MMVPSKGTLEGCFASGDTWTEQPCRVTLLAGELEVVLDEQALILYDVRDLLALRRRLERALQARSWWPWTGFARRGVATDRGTAAKAVRPSGAVSRLAGTLTRRFNRLKG
jgi:hypothetical protein